MPERFDKPPRLLAGHSVRIDDPAVPELKQCGEQWAAGHFRVDHHQHGGYWEVYLQLAGSSSWALGPRGGGGTVLGPGEGYLVAPRVGHRLVPRGDASQHRFCYAILDLDALVQRMSDLAPALGAGQTRFHTGPAEVLRDPFRLLMGEVLGTAAHRGLGLRLAVDALALACARFATDDHATRRQPGRHGVALACERMMADPAQPWTIDDLAHIAGASRNGFCRHFRQEVGTSPHRHLLGLRLERARAQLRDTDAAITAIALDCGFASSQHFATAFRSQHGCTPSAWRQRHRT